MPKNARMYEKTVTCFYCGIVCEGTGTQDHFVPRSKFPKAPGQKHPPRKSTLRGNKVFACRRCNQAKGDMTFEEFKETIYYLQNCKTGRWKGLVLRG